MPLYFGRTSISSRYAFVLGEGKYFPKTGLCIWGRQLFPQGGPLYLGGTSISSRCAFVFWGDKYFPRNAFVFGEDKYFPKICPCIWGGQVFPQGGPLYLGRTSISQDMPLYRVSLKKGTFLIFCVVSVLEVGFYFFTCVLESEF